MVKAKFWHLEGLLAFYRASFGVGERKMCDCIKKLSELNYILTNLLKSGQYFLPATKNGRVLKDSPYMGINHCPICGKSLSAEQEGK